MGAKLSGTLPLVKQFITQYAAKIAQLIVRIGCENQYDVSELIISGVNGERARVRTVDLLIKSLRFHMILQCFLIL